MCNNLCGGAVAEASKKETLKQAILEELEDGDDVTDVDMQLAILVENVPLEDLDRALEELIAEGKVKKMEKTFYCRGEA